MEASVLHFEGFRVDRANAQVWRGREALPLTPKAFAVLRYLLEHAGQLVTKEELLGAVWTETVVTDGALVVCVHELRRVLGDEAKQPRYIETVHRRGYRFLPAVTTTPPVASRQYLVASREGQSTVQGLQSTIRIPHSAIPPVGRESELRQLQEWLDKALAGERQLVFVTGGPGIGKTALVDAFLTGVREQGSGNRGPVPADPRSLTPAPWLAWGQCIEQHGAGEAYLPVLEALGRLCRMPEGERLITVLQQYAPTWLAQLPALLSTEQREALQRQTLGATKPRMLREMAEALEALTAEQPLVLWLEDLHWSDASTLDLLALLARRQERAQLLIIGSYRPVEVLDDGHPLLSVTQELRGHQLCAELAPRRLMAADIEAYLRQRFPISALPNDWAQTLARHSGGNPLFLTAIVADLVTRGVLAQVEGCWTVQRGGETSELRAPEDLRQLIARQSARLRPAEQKILEAASLAGMEFSAAAVAAALESEVAEIERHCEHLARQQQFVRRMGIEEWPDGTVAARYSFLHALYQHLWHERVTPARQVWFHLRIGGRKEAAYDGRVQEIAAELAVHFEQGRDYQKAVQYQQKAAQNALHRHAPQEALRHFMTANELLSRLPNTPARTLQELRLQLALGGLLMTVRGYAALEVEQTYSRARALGAAVGAPPQDLFHGLWGLFAFHLIRLELDTAYALGEQLCTLALELSDPAAMTGAHVALGVVEHHRGNFVRACEHLARGTAIPPSRSSVLDLVHFSQDPWITGLCYEAFALALLGYLDQAQQRLQQALDRAQVLADPFSLAFCHEFMCFIAYWRRDSQLVAVHAEQLLALATEPGFLMRIAAGHICRGWVLAEQQPREAVAEIRKGITAWHTTGAALCQSFFLSFLVEAARRGQMFTEGIAAVAEALEWGQRTGERFYEAELYRLKGELLLRQSEWASGRRGERARRK